jgi:hypothetical protein
MKSKYMQFLQENLIDMSKMEKYKGTVGDLINHRTTDKMETHKNADNVVSILEKMYTKEDSEDFLSESDDSVGNGPTDEIVAPIEKTSLSDAATAADDAALPNGQQPDQFNNTATDANDTTSASKEVSSLGESLFESDDEVIGDKEDEDDADDKDEKAEVTEPVNKDETVSEAKVVAGQKVLSKGSNDAKNKMAKLRAMKSKKPVKEGALEKSQEKTNQGDKDNVGKVDVKNKKTVKEGNMPAAEPTVGDLMKQGHSSEDVDLSTEPKDDSVATEEPKKLDVDGEIEDDKVPAETDIAPTDETCEGCNCEAVDELLDDEEPVDTDIENDDSDDLGSDDEELDLDSDESENEENPVEEAQEEVASVDKANIAVIPQGTQAGKPVTDADIKTEPNGPTITTKSVTETIIRRKNTEEKLVEKLIREMEIVTSSPDSDKEKDVDVDDLDDDDLTLDSLFDAE